MAVPSSLAALTYKTGCHNCHVYILYTRWLLAVIWTVKHAWCHAIFISGGSQCRISTFMLKVSLLDAGADGWQFTRRSSVGTEGAAGSGAPATTREAERDAAGQWCSASLEG